MGRNNRRKLPNVPDCLVEMEASTSIPGEIQATAIQHPSLQPIQFKAPRVLETEWGELENVTVIMFRHITPPQHIQSSQWCMEWKQPK